MRNHNPRVTSLTFPIFNLIVINSCGGVFANIREHVPGAGGIAAVLKPGD